MQLYLQIEPKATESDVDEEYVIVVKHGEMNNVSGMAMVYAEADSSAVEATRGEHKRYHPDPRQRFLTISKKVLVGDGCLCTVYVQYSMCVSV